MALQGMDVEAAGPLATQCSNGGSEITQLASTLNSQLTNFQWVGNDATTFMNDWSAQYYPDLQKVAQALQDVSQTITREANQQATASGN